MDVQRWLASAGVPTVVLVEGVSDELEAVLLDRGAHDVVSLPVQPRTLGARLEAMGRSLRALPAARRVPAKVHVADLLILVPARRTAHVRQSEVDLTKSEYDLLLALALRHPYVMTRTDIAEALGRPTITARSLESHVSRLRDKLGRAGAGNVLVTVRGVGYRLEG
jgi:DNA-binding response OmpR family regulator